MNYAVLKTYVDTYIKENGVEGITGEIFNAVLDRMIDDLGDYRFGGAILPISNFPYSTDINSWFITSKNGTYTNFGDIKVLDELVIITFDGTFHKFSVMSNYIPNILANLGVGAETSLPTTALDGDIYVSTDTLTIFTSSSGDYIETTISRGQMVTDTLTSTLYQYNGYTLEAINSETLQVKDKNIELAKVVTPTDDTADGGGITLLGATSKTITWVKSKLAWVFNQAVEITGNLTIESGNIFGSNSSFIIGTNSTDGLDNKRLQLSAASTVSGDRGAAINIMGNEYSGQEGDIALYTGNSTFSRIRFFTGNNVERMQLEKGGNLGLGTGALGAALGKVDISNGGLSLVIGADSNADTRTNSTVKYGRICAPHYTNIEEPVAMIMATSEAADNRLFIGGGTELTNAVTQISFYTASNNTTLTGNKRLEITNNLISLYSNNTEKLRLDQSGRLYHFGTSSIAVDICSGNVAALFGADANAITRTNETQKITRLASAHYINGEEPCTLMHCVSESTYTNLNIGGGTGTMNTITRLAFYTAANNTTVVGTERMCVLSNGNVGINKTVPTEKLDVGGNIAATGSVKIGTDATAASSSNVGAIRYTSTANSSSMEMVMQTGASTYAWVVIKTNTW